MQSFSPLKIFFVQLKHMKYDGFRYSFTEVLKIAVSKRFWQFFKKAPFSLFLEILIWKKNELETSKNGVLKIFLLAPFRLDQKDKDFENGALRIFVQMVKKR